MQQRMLPRNSAGADSLVRTSGKKQELKLFRQKSRFNLSLVKMSVNSNEDLATPSLGYQFADIWSEDQPANKKSCPGQV
jgi:hypothetical protein